MPLPSLRSPRMRVVVAPDKFKGSLDAAGVATALATGIRRARPDWDIRIAPVADGGDGTVDAFVAAGWAPVEVATVGPTGVPRTTRYARRDTTAIIELADAVGLRALPGGRLDPLGASTFGLGTVIRAALDAGAAELVVGLGGSASSDGGAGLLQALGARLTDRSGHEIPRGAAGLAGVAMIDLTGLPPTLRTVRMELAADVDNPLLGRAGAVAVFGRQKGIDDPAPVEAALHRWADLLAAATGRDPRDTPGAGAAGGTGFALSAVARAEFRSGVDLVLGRTGLADTLRTADLVVTGEGALDEQSLAGKAPIGVARTARGVPVVAVAGRNLLTAGQAQDAGFAAVYALSELEPDPQRSIAGAGRLLETIGERIGQDAVRWAR